MLIPHRAASPCIPQSMMEAPPEGLATDPEGLLPTMLSGDLEALTERLTKALAAAIRAGQRHAAGLEHLAAIVEKNR